MVKIVTADMAAELVRSGWTVTTGGFGSCGHPESITAAIERRFSETSNPRDLTLLFSAGQGDKATRGINRLAAPGLLRRVIGGYWALAPKIGDLAKREEIEAHNWPQGVIAHLFRAIANGAPGVISTVGLGTFIDPRYAGGRLNERAEKGLVELISLKGKEYLLYPTMPIDCAIIRGTTADEKGNISMEREANFQDALAQATAAHNSGGIVIAQVERIVAEHQDPHLIKVPGVLVDYVVEAEPDLHWQTYGERFNPLYVSRRERGRPVPLETDVMSARMLIARRAYLEMESAPGAVVNLGIGIPEMIASVAKKEGNEAFTLTVESGAIGGYPAGGMSFGATITPQAVIDQPSLFDLYDGGGIDIAFLGNAQTDGEGNVNVSRFGARISGVGGFVNISQAAKKVVFCGTFTTGGCVISVTDGILRIEREGKINKFLRSVEHLSFNAKRARELGQEVMYVTERCVFRLIDDVLTLVEVAPGIDPYRDIVDLAGAEIVVSDDLALMDSRVFSARTHSYGTAEVANQQVAYYPPPRRYQ